MARVLITGGCGFIGSHLAEHLASRGDDVTVFDAAAPGGAEPHAGGTLGRGNPGRGDPGRGDPGRGDPGRGNPVRYIQADIRDESAVAKAVADSVDVVYHMSAVVGVDRYLTAPADVAEVNLLGTLNVLRGARETGAKVLVASTSEVYGKNPDAPWREDSDRVLGSTAADRWSYSTSKALAEHLTFGYIRQYGVRASIVRYFNVYGPRQRPAYVVSRSIHRALHGLAPEIYDGGGQTRCFTYIDDAIRGTVLAAMSPAADGEHFNIGNHRETTIAEVVSIISQLTGIPVPAAQVDTAAAWGTRYEDIPRRVPDTTKARTMLGWECTTSLRDGLAATIEWAREAPWWLDGLRDEAAPVQAAPVQAAPVHAGPVQASSVQAASVHAASVQADEAPIARAQSGPPQAEDGSR